LAREVVMLRLEGHSTAEIARLIGRSTRAVERHLSAVRSRWADLIRTPRDPRGVEGLPDVR
jgi:DNA-directed RNA polymerase specialized sigma24 family protein